MALIRNGANVLMGLSRHDGAFGAAVMRGQMDKSGKFKNFDSGEHAIANVTNKSGRPDGYRHPLSWKMGTKPGAMVSANDIEFTATLTGDGNYGRNQTATINWDTQITQAALGLIAGADATINWTMTLPTPAIGGTQNMLANIDPGMTVTVTASISAESGLASTINWTATLNGSTLSGLGDIDAIISGASEAVTPTSVAAEVWNSVALAFNTAGTMGNKMNSAASAGDPWTTNLPGSYLAGTAGQIIGTLQNDINLHTDSAIATLNLQELKFAIESLRPHHTGYGTAYYWNPTSGDDGADGLTPQTACATFAHIHDDLVENYGHDIIYCIPESAGTGITSAEGIVISKNYVFVRGPGRDFEIDTSISGGTGVQITGKGVELHGVRVKTDVLSSADAVIISGDFAYIDDVWIEECGGDGIAITTSSNTIINESRIRNCAGNGVNVGNSVSNLWIIGAEIAEADGSAIYVNGTNVFDVKVMGETSLDHNARYGVEIVAMSGEVVVSTDATFDNNTLGDTLAIPNTLLYAGRVNQKNSMAVEFLAAPADGSTTLAESVRLQNAVLAGKVSGAGTGTEVFRDLADTKDRITATVDVSGNRTAIIKDAT